MLSERKSGLKAEHECQKNLEIKLELRSKYKKRIILPVPAFQAKNRYSYFHFQSGRKEREK